VTFVSVPGSPFTPIPSADGCWIFVGLPNHRELAAFQRTEGQLKLRHTVPLPAAPTGMVLTHDGQLLLAATGDSVTALDVAALRRGDEHPRIHRIKAAEFGGAIYVNVTGDDKYLFVANERANSLTVVNLQQTRAGNFKTPVIVGDIPTGELPIAVTLSPDGRRLYSTSEVASGLSGITTSCETGPPGEIEVIDVARAERDPAHSVLSLAGGGCSPVRLILSPDGNTAYVTARGENHVLAFDTARLASDPMHALLGQVPAGTAPVGIALSGNRLVVASSDRFGNLSAPQHLIVLSSDWRSWQKGSTLAAELPAGSFPREERLSPDGKTLYVTNFASRQLEIVDLTRLPPLGPLAASEPAASAAPPEPAGTGRAAPAHGPLQIAASLLMSFCRVCAPVPPGSWAGKARVNLLVGTDGATAKATLAPGQSRVPAAATQAVLATVRQWRFDIPYSGETQPRPLQSTVLVVVSNAASGAVRSNELALMSSCLECLAPAPRTDWYGGVPVHVRVGADGAVQDVAIMGRSSDLPVAVGDAVRKVVKRWRFQPLLLDGKPAPIQATVRVSVPPAVFPSSTADGGESDHGGSLGLEFGNIGPAMVSRLGLPNAQGAVIFAVLAGGAGAKAGFKPDDVVTAINQSKVMAANYLSALVGEMAPGTPATVTLLRDGKGETMPVTIGSRDDIVAPAQARFGAQVAALTRTRLAQLRLPATF
jgi:TonB family protein